jgi:small-conductance mechanosensitive channel
LTPEEYFIVRVVFAVLSIALAIFLGSKLGDLVIRNLSKFGRSFASKLAEIVKYFLIILGAVVAFSVLSLDVMVLTGISIGIFIALLISMRDVFSNYAGEIYLRVRRPFDEGDFIKIGRISGRVVSINSQDVELVSVKGERIVVPNQFFLKYPVVNKSSATPSSIELKVIFNAVAPEEAERIVMEALNEIRPELFEEPKIVSINTRDSKTEVDISLSIANQQKIKWLIGRLSKKLHDRGVEVEIE